MGPSGREDSELEVNGLGPCGPDPSSALAAGNLPGIFKPQFPCLENRQRMQHPDNPEKALLSLRIVVNECAQGHPANVKTRAGPRVPEQAEGWEEAGWQPAMATGLWE